MTDNTDLPRDLGRLEGRITALESRVAEGDRRNEAAFDELKHTLGEIKTQLSSAALIDASRVGNIKGAWWILTALLSVAGTIGGIVAWLLKANLNPHQ